MIILGLTGSIGMGKTTAAKAFLSLGVPVYDADQAIHKLMGPGGAAVAAVLSAFPGVEKNGAIDRQALGARVFDNPAKLRRLENILHPRARKIQQAFLATAARRGEKLVVLDIPLLLETGGDAFCDGVVVVSAPLTVQLKRVMGRPGMTKERLESILKLQIPDRDKCKMADFVVKTGLGRSHSLREIAKIVGVTKTWLPRHWPPIKNRTRD